MNYINSPSPAVIQGHDLLALERFFDTTRHMIEFDVLTHNSPVGDKGYKYRVFLSEEGYQKALSAQKHGDIRIFKHARVIEGHILYDTKKHQISR
jgi:hypothetical protein